MDGIFKWLFQGTREPLVSNIPTNNIIKTALDRADVLKLQGKFQESWDHETYAYSIILDILFDDGRIADANEFTAKTIITPEMQDYINQETAYKYEIDQKKIREEIIENAYYLDQIFLDEEQAQKNRADKLILGRAVEKVSDDIIETYTNTVKRLNTERAKEILLAKEREKQKAEQARLQALRDAQDEIRMSAEIQARRNAPVDTSMNVYMRKKIRLDTANEINESTQSIYRIDLVYLFFKLLLFVVLGCIFYYLMKDQTPKNVVDTVKETTKAVGDTISKTTKSIKETIKGSINDKLKGNTNDIVRV